MSGECASLTQGILAYNNIDLISNGYINETDSDRRGRQVRLLPANRISVEFQYSIRSDLSGTSLNSLSPGGNAGFVTGGLGLGAGFFLGAAIGCSLLGDIEPTRSQFIFHVCRSETRVNRSFLVTEEMLAEAAANNGVATYEFFGEYPIAFLGITKKPLNLSDEEILAIGSSGGPTRGHRITAQGLIQARFANYDSSSSDNLFIEIYRDPRKFQYRADNNIPGDSLAGANAFLDGGADDLVDRKVKFQLLPVSNPSQPAPDPATLPKVGDSMYMTFDIAMDRYFRQAIFVSSFFFLFPNFIVERIGVDQVKAWNFQPKKFRAHKNVSRKATIADINNDDAVAVSTDLDDQQKAARTRLETIEGQRLVEVLNDTKTNKPYIRGFYFADSRGILAFDMKNFTTEPRLLVPAEQIQDQAWWQSFIAGYMDGGPGFNSSGELDVMSDGAARLLRGFVFDVSDHVNAVCYDNDKFGYQRQLAMALLQVSKKDPNTPGSGVGFPNLDLIRQSLPHSQQYDLSSAVFEPYDMSSIEGGAYFVRDCNKVFTYDQQFCASGTVQSDMFIRTPFMFHTLPIKSRVYVERFTPQFALSPDGGIWVATSPVTGDNISIDTHPYRDDAFLVFNKDQKLNYQRFSDALTRMHSSFTVEDDDDKSLNHAYPSLDGLSQEDIPVVGYDRVIGNQPGYSRGLEITRESGKIALGLEHPSIYKIVQLPFVQNQENGTATVTSMANRKIRSIRIFYRADVSDFAARKQRFLTFIFPGSNLVIDNVALPYLGGSLNKERLLSFDARYYSDESMRISGDILKYITLTKVEIVYLTDEKYAENSIEAGASSAVFDAQGRLYVFYEDTKAGDGDVPSGNGPGLVTSNPTEISCLVSHDMGYTWFDYKGIVRTIGDETVRYPYAVCDRLSNTINLLYIHNDALIDKKINPTLFDPKDAFKAYKRPLVYNEDLPGNYALTHFTVSGQQMRQSESSVVIANLDKGKFINSQLSIDEARRADNKTTRFGIAGDRKNFGQGFAESAFIAMLDRKNALKVFYVSNGKLHARICDNNGRDWRDAIPDGVLFHKNVNIQEPRFISSLGYAFDEDSNILHLSYVADEMLFLRSFDLSIFEQNNSELQRIVDPDEATSSPLFVVGVIADELTKALRTFGTNVRFTYSSKAIAAFDQSMSISDVPARGYVGASGLARFYYFDGNGDIRAFSLADSKGPPLLDAKRKTRSL